MQKKRKRRRILMILLGLFLLAQFIQPSKNQGNAEGPQDIRTAVQTPTPIMAILQKSCYDCHSNRTTYPWYDHIFPANWWVNDHIESGKAHLNFTTFAAYPDKKKAKKLDEIAETVENGEMPLKSYLILHGDAKLSESERKAVIDWAQASATQFSIRN